ncbi:MAG: helix-turn-helix transcriptional regulator [Halofilum sp. (in: g-proteobacteria)]
MTIPVSEEVAELARDMGKQLREGRRRRYPHDTQDDFARRIGVSRYTYQKMEQGDPSVALRSYLFAAVLLGIGHQFAEGLAPPRRGLFDENPGS